MKFVAQRACVLGALALTAAGALSYASAVTNDYGFVVIVNKANPINSLKRGKLVSIFMAQISRWPFGAEILPIDGPSRSPARAAFVKVVLKTTEDSLRAYWIDQKLTRNIDPPREAAAAEAKRLVASKPGAIAYVPHDVADDTVKVLAIE